MINKILKFQSKLNMKFKNKDLLIKSLTHKSYSSINTNRAQVCN